MLNELEFDNEDAYREILRIPPPDGRKRPRLVYSRNFYGSLEDMSRYWDNSKDNYYDVEAKDPEPQAPQYSQQIATKAEDLIAPKQDEQVTEAAQQERPKTLQSNNVSRSGLSAEQSVSDTIEIPTRSKMKQVYKGQRLGNGEQMSPSTRVSIVRNLLKMVIHKFNCRDFESNPKDKLRFTTVNVPSVFYHFCVAKMPSEMKFARARMVEGPIMAVHARSEVRFKSSEGLQNPASDFLGERFDLFREVGCLLLLAKQRSREGKDPAPVPAEHQWWASKVRWGGGETRWGQLANEVYEDEDPSWSPEEALLQKLKRDKDEEQERQEEAAAAADLKNLRTDDLIADTSTSGERPKKKKRSGEGNGTRGKGGVKVEYKDGKRVMFTQPIRRKWYQDWTKIRPNALAWDEKVIYRKIGQQSKEDGGNGWDDVYLLSAVNHHVCLMRLSVHEDYLEWLETGKTVHPDGNASEGQRQPHVLYVSRSNWYDLFDIAQRKELLTGVWRVMSWLNRDEVPKQEFKKMDEVKRKDAGETGDHHMEI
ncbi:uncharacterized protein A1O9_03205 [Exophiala aquamarina CBS 119918]|uniref:Uncharacterized protein n=1 Tax=Exophiala aquamarina CBS 119918 TaxID=1182545 RepID=A0A072PPG3_9EURO|nr:uncharacterized protein A1O9_03205 [Exophiala aquamarina CBS 119918]KEF61637.1 hypothetical protein A1O9_03205 [Exophiala aquamarina CBS 119918]